MFVMVAIGLFFSETPTLVDARLCIAACVMWVEGDQHPLPSFIAVYLNGHFNQF